MNAPKPAHVKPLSKTAAPKAEAYFAVIDHGAEGAFVNITKENVNLTYDAFNHSNRSILQLNLKETVKIESFGAIKLNNRVIANNMAVANAFNEATSRFMAAHAHETNPSRIKTETPAVKKEMAQLVTIGNELIDYAKDGLNAEEAQAIQIKVDKILAAPLKKQSDKKSGHRQEVARNS